MVPGWRAPPPSVMRCASLQARATRLTRCALHFTVLVVPQRGRWPQPVRLKMTVGPGDDWEPVITILRPSED